MDDSLFHEELTLTSADGGKLFAQRWAPAVVKAELLVVPGYGDHGGRYRRLAHHLARASVATTALDLRGHGRSPGQRGHVNRWADYLADVDAAFQRLPVGPRFVLGHSMGGLIALDWVSQRPAQAAGLNGLMVTNPFLALAMAVPKWKLALGDVAAQLLPRLALPNGLEAAQMSHDPEVVQNYDRDPLVFHTATAGWFQEVKAAQARVLALTAVPARLLYFFSDSDPVALPMANRTLAAALTAPDKTVRERQGELHEILGETDWETVFGEIADWMKARLS